MKETDNRQLTWDQLLKQLPDIPEALVMRLAFGVPRDATPEYENDFERAMAILLSPEYVRTFQFEIKKLISALQAQIQTYKLGLHAGNKMNPAWYKKVASLNARLVSLLVRVNGCVKDLNRQNSVSRGAKSGQLRQAIQRHRSTVTEEFEPTPADVELWKILDLDLLT